MASPYSEDYKPADASQVVTRRYLHKRYGEFLHEIDTRGHGLDRRYQYGFMYHRMCWKTTDGEWKFTPWATANQRIALDVSDTIQAISIAEPVDPNWDKGIYVQDHPIMPGVHLVLKLRLKEEIDPRTP